MCSLQAPLAPVKVKSAKQKIRTKDNIKFPLVVDYERCVLFISLKVCWLCVDCHPHLNYLLKHYRWQPFRRSAYNRDKQTTSRKKRIPQPEDRKFFGALIKPKVNIITSVLSLCRNDGEVELFSFTNFILILFLTKPILL